MFLWMYVYIYIYMYVHMYINKVIELFLYKYELNQHIPAIKPSFSI